VDEVDSVAHPTDEELIARCRESLSRSREIFSLLYERHHVELFNFLHRYLGNFHLAEDVLQETFLRVFRNLHRFEPERRLADWIYTIALNAARDLQRRKKGAHLDTDMAVAGGDATPAEQTSKKEEAKLLERLILDLPDEERAVFILNRVEGKTLQEAADAMGFSLRTAKNRLAAAFEQLARSGVA